MNRWTIILVPEGSTRTRNITLPAVGLRLGTLALFVVVALLGYASVDYLALLKIREHYHQVVAENEGLRGEANLLMSNLDNLKRDLKKVQDYSTKLSELTQLAVQKVSKETGIGPLSSEEYEIARKQQTLAMLPGAERKSLPLGVSMESLEFRAAHSKVSEIHDQAYRQAIDLQQLLSTLSQRKSLLHAIPSVSPVNGWITSGFGHRISPFTGERAMHMGIDVASPIGTPIYAPADGIVIFAGKKDGFGKFVMVAHGYGIVSHYGHIAQILVEPGQKLQRGTQIGTVGMTGRTTGPHLHYEVWVNGKATNPRKFILEADANNLVL